MPSSLKTCSYCGYEKNGKNAFKCGLCGAAFPKALQETEAAPLPETHDKPDIEVPVIRRRDFAEEIIRNRWESMIILLGIPLILVILGLSIGGAYGHPEAGLAVAVVISVITAFAAYFGGDRMILGFSKAKKADEVGDARVINVVDEMRIAAGLPMPEVYVIDSMSPNAFATGRNPEHAKVAVTRGLVKLLSREELQGVVAHEISHVRNFDIRYMMIVAAMVGVVALIADGFRRSLWFGRGFGRRSGGRGGGGQLQLVFFIVAILMSILAPISVVALQMAVSRKREFLADSSAVELTRNPDALASALEKLEKRTQPLESANRATQHLYIVNPLKVFGMKSGAVFSTHPPIESRIRLLRSMT